MTDYQLAGLAIMVGAALLFVGLLALFLWDLWLASRKPSSLQADCATMAWSPELQAGATVDVEARTITGLVIPWEEYGDTSVGRVIAGAGSVRVPDDLSRVKLVDQHQVPPRAIGYGLTAGQSSQGITMGFRIGRTPEGDRALLEASEHLSDAFSVELSQLQLQGDRITDSYLGSVALLPVPAFASARVASVTAALSSTTPTQEGNTMTEEQRARLQELLALSARTPEQETEYQTLAQLAVQAQVATTTEPPPAQPAQAAAGANPELVAQLVQLMTGQAPAQVPAGLQAGQAPALSAAPRPLQDLYAAAARTFRGESRPQLEAALSDITQSANAFTTQDQYAGQLWQALSYTRIFTNLLKGGDGILRSYKGNGWKWGVAPAVAAYAGDKAAVPSNSPTTTNVPWTASRLAGAHDIDRKFRDFGDEEFIQAYYEAMTLSYAMLSDNAARDFVVASATAGAAVTGGLLVGAAKVAGRLMAATNNIPPDYVLVNDQDKIGLLSVTAASVPAFLADFLNIQPNQFIGTTAVPAGTVIAGNYNAGEFKELPGSPIRVELVNQVNAGIDGGVFGYYATILNMPTAIQKAAWT